MPYTKPSVRPHQRPCAQQDNDSERIVFALPEMRQHIRENVLAGFCAAWRARARRGERFGWFLFYRTCRDAAGHGGIRRNTVECGRENASLEEGDNLLEACPPPDTGRGRGPTDTSSREAGTQETLGGAGVKRSETESSGRLFHSSPFPPFLKPKSSFCLLVFSLSSKRQLTIENDVCRSPERSADLGRVGVFS